MVLGSGLSRLSIIRDAGDTNNSSYLIWTVHHAIMDAWAIKALLFLVSDLSYGTQCILQPLPISILIFNVYSTWTTKRQLGTRTRTSKTVRFPGVLFKLVSVHLYATTRCVGAEEPISQSAPRSIHHVA